MKSGLSAGCTDHDPEDTRNDLCRAERRQRALADVAEELEETPYVVTVDEQSSRRMWDGLQNIRLGDSPENRKSRYWLPGSTLGADERPRAIVRINIEADEVPQPVSATYIAKTKDSKPVEKETATTLYRVTTDFGTPAWIFCNVPRAYDGASAGRLGSKYTRWDAKRSVASDKKEERRKGEMSQNWYAMTASVMGGSRGCGPACRLRPGYRGPVPVPGSYLRSQGSPSGKQVPGTSRASQTPPISAQASTAQLREGIGLADRPRRLQLGLGGPGAS